MKKCGVLFMAVLFGLTFSSAFASAGWFGDAYNKITGNAVSTDSCDGADLNLDGNVTVEDFILIKQNYGCSDNSSECVLADINGDGEVDMDDFLIFKQNYGSSNCGDNLTEEVDELDEEYNATGFENNSCVDSDGGMSPYEAGYIYFKAGSFESNHSDVCAEVTDYSSEGLPSGWQSADSCSGEDCFVEEAFCRTDSLGNFVDADADELIFCPYGCENGACIEQMSCSDLVHLNEDLIIGRDLWELTTDLPYLGRGSSNYYKHFSKSDEDRYVSIGLNIEELDSSDVSDLEEDLLDSVENGFCEQDNVYSSSGEEYFIYVCRSLWDVAEGVEDEGRITALWISDNRFFILDSYSFDYDDDYCNSYEDCLYLEEAAHRERQSEVMDTFEDLIDNEEEYFGDFYLSWDASKFVEYLIDSCGSDVEEQEGYVGSWTCKTEPVICPPHGEQTEVCTRYNEALGKDEVREATISCSPGICSGCYVPRWFDYSGDKTCIPYGTRFEHQTGWKLEEIFVQDEDVESLTVADALDEGDELLLDVYPSGVAILTLLDYQGNRVNLTLQEGMEYNWGELIGETEDSFTYMVTANEIYYDSSNYNDSYIKVTLSIEGWEQEKTADTFNAYCNYDGRILEQKSVGEDGSWATCQNNYECESNLCSGGNCVEINELISEVSGMKSIGVRVLCKLADLFGVETYEQCIADSLGE